MSTAPKAHHPHSIWAFAFGYFACYVPYSGLTKALTRGALPTAAEPVTGVMLLPVATAAGLALTLAFLVVSGWWRSATLVRVAGVELPIPTRWTTLSGLCTALIMTTTTLAYTFDGVSIVFVMLLMRGGVLIVAPLVDALSGRRARWFSWVGLALSMGALVVAFAEDGGTALTAACALDVAVYLASYVVRLRLMSHLAKTDDPAATRRYFTEEQLVVGPATLLTLGLLATFGDDPFTAQLRAGFLDLPRLGPVGWTALIGFLSQGVGIFGTLVFLDKRENTFSVPVNRSSSILAGVVASGLLAALLGLPLPSAWQLAGAGLVVAAVVVLAAGPGLERRWREAQKT